MDNIIIHSSHLSTFYEAHLTHKSRASNRAGRSGLSLANNGLGQNQVGSKLARIFWAKILVAHPALKTRLVGPNSLLKAKKIPAGRAGSGHTEQGHIGPGQIWPGFFRANNLMAQPHPNSGWIGLAHRAGPILPPLPTTTNHDQTQEAISQKGDKVPVLIFPQLLLTLFKLLYLTLFKRQIQIKTIFKNLPFQKNKTLPPPEPMPLRRSTREMRSLCLLA